MSDKRYFASGTSPEGKTIQTSGETEKEAMLTFRREYGFLPLTIAYESSSGEMVECWAFPKYRVQVPD